MPSARLSSLLEPLERGYGMTLGNALRRVLLSSIRGAAITSVRIEGVLHEFSTVPGVREDVIEIMMNLKHVPVRSRSKEVRVISVELEKAGLVTARDIQVDSEVDFVDRRYERARLPDGKTGAGRGSPRAPLARRNSFFLCMRSSLSFKAFALGYFTSTVILSP